MPTVVEGEVMTPICSRCQDTYWVCEKHLDQPWSDDLPNGCACGAGAPCPDCKPRASRSIRRVRGSTPPTSVVAETKRASRLPSMAKANAKRQPVTWPLKRVSS